MKIITLDANYKALEEKTFEDIPEMAAELKIAAKTNNPKVGYIDILMPVFPFKQENLAVVDTPGIGDSRQKEVAKRMMEYLPNALAFVFVVNVPAAGGLQKDRIARILEHVKKSQKKMVSFSRRDVIFLLNKWDALLEDDDKENFFETAKSNFRDIWSDIDEKCILKFSTKRDFAEQATMLEKFKIKLSEVIVKNKEKRIKMNLRFLHSLMEKCMDVVSTKLKHAMWDAERSSNKLDQLLITIQKLEKIRCKESKNVDENVKRFLDEVTTQFNRHMDDPTTHAEILKHVERSWRLKIEFDIDTCIENETKEWEEKHVQQIFQETIVQTLDKQLRKISKSETEDLMKGFRVPINLYKNRSYGLFNTALSVAGGIALSACLFESHIAMGVAASGTVMAGAIRFGFLKDFKDVCERALKVRIDKLSKEIIRKALDDRYANTIKCTIRNALKTMQTNINRMQEEGKKKESNHTVNTSKLDIIMSLNSTISDIKERLLNIEEKIH